MGKKSKTKGSGFERDIAKAIIKKFVPHLEAKEAYNLVHRTPLSGGHVERGDLICKPPILKYFPWFVECRNREVWTWKQIWEQGQDSVVLRWFYEDAIEKCHPYDHNDSPTHHRWPLLLFTKNFRKVYAVVTERDAETWFADDLEEGYSLQDVLGCPVMRVYIDKPLFKGYVVIADFDSFLALHDGVYGTVIQHEIDEYLGKVD